MMHSVWWGGRSVARALCRGLAYATQAPSPGHQPQPHRTAARLTTVASGFGKDLRQLGGGGGRFERKAAADAGGEAPAGAMRSERRLDERRFGDDAWFFAASDARHVDVIGVADGVGGWRAYGIDPGQFSSFLMRTCRRLVELGHFDPLEPARLIARSYYELLEHKKPVLGSSTACVLILNRDTSIMCTANIGDSGYIVLRRGQIVHRSQEQQHYFNTPFQLSLPPPGHGSNVLSDRPESADTAEFSVEHGDVILVATDGVFDNVPEAELVCEMRRAEGVEDAAALQIIANSIAHTARSLSFDEHFMSPFAEHARQSGIDAIGGKPDDITVLLATVAL